MEKKRIYRGYLIFGLLLLLEMVWLFVNSGVVPALSGRADRLKAYALASRDDATILPGDIYDRNQKVLAETRSLTVLETAANGKRREKTVRSTQYPGGRSYSQLIGYTGSHSLNALADSLEEVVGKRRGYRLMAFLDEDNGQLWGDNGLYQTVNIDGRKGQSAVLTIDDELQQAVYQALAGEMEEEDSMGCAIVLNAKTAEILAMVAFPTYDFNDLNAAIAKMNEDEQETDLEPGFPISYKNARAPGSIFKLLTAVSLIDHGLEDYTVADESFQVDGWICNNSYTSDGKPIGYQTALERSSNVYFAHAALELGREAFEETAEKFLLTEDEILLDFGSIAYHWDLNVDDNKLAQTGFGQGNATLSGIYAAMITEAIANDGKMMKPYLIRELIDDNGKTVYEGKAETLTRPTTVSTANKVTQAMVAAARYGSTHHKGLGNTSEIFETYQVAGKTGTAQNGDAHDTLNAWFVSFAPADDPQYVVVVNQCKTNKGGYRMMKPAAEIYSYLFRNQGGQEE